MSGADPKTLQNRFRQIFIISIFVFFASLTFSKALMEISFFTALVSFIAWKKKTFFQSGIPVFLTRSLGFYLFFVFLSFVFSENHRASLRGIEKVLSHALIFWMVATSMGKEGLIKKFENLAMGAGIVMVLNGFFQWKMGWDLIRHHPPEPSGAGVRLSGAFSSYGQYACFIILAWPYLAALTLKAWDAGRKIFFSAGIFACSGLLIQLFMTRSRGAMLAFLIGALIFLVRQKHFRILFFFAGIAAIGVALLPRNVVIHLDAEGKEQSLVERFELWHRAFDVIKAKPILGTGVNTYAATHQKYDTRKNWRVRNYYAHNGYLQMGAECGVLGVAAFLVFVILLLFYGAAVERREAGLLPIPLGIESGILNFMIFALVDTILHNPQPVLSFWFFLGLLAAYRFSSEPIINK